MQDKDVKSVIPFHAVRHRSEGRRWRVILHSSRISRPALRALSALLFLSLSVIVDAGGLETLKTLRNAQGALPTTQLSAFLSGHDQSKDLELYDAPTELMEDGLSPPLRQTAQPLTSEEDYFGVRGGNGWIDEDGEDDIDAARGVIANWRKSTPLRPCFGCTPGLPMAFSSMFSECSFVTLGAHMGIAPAYSKLVVRTNDTVLVRLVGSRLFFSEASDLFSFLTDFLHGTCPESNRLQNLTSMCSWNGARTGPDIDAPPCTIYAINATKIHDQVPGGAALDRPQAHGLYGPGTYRFSFRDFENSDFPYAFWVLQYLRAEQVGGNLANVTVVGQFNNQPPPVPPVKLFTSVFIAAVILFTVFAVFFNPWIGAEAADLGTRVPWFRRTFLRSHNLGSVPQPRSYIPTRRHSAWMPSSSSASGYHMRSMVSSEDYHLLETGPYSSSPSTL